MFSGAKLTYFFVMATAIFVQLAVFAVAKIDSSGQAAADLAFYLMVSAFSTGVLTLGGVNVTVDMLHRNRLKEEIAFYFYLVIGGAVLFSAIFSFTDLISLGDRQFSTSEKATISLYVMTAATAALAGGISAVCGRPSDSSKAERLYAFGVVVFLIGAYLSSDAKLSAYLIAALAYVFFARRLLDKNIVSLIRTRPRLPTSQGVSVLAWNFSNSFLAYGFQYLDAFLIGLCLTHKDLGVYFLLAQVAFVPKYFSVQLGRVILPYLSKIDAADNYGLRRLRLRLVYFIVSVALFSLIVLIAMRNGGLNYFGDSYALKSDTLTILIVGSIVSLPGPILYSTLIAHGFTKEFARVNIAGGVVLLVFQFFIFVASENVDVLSLFAAARFISTALCQVLLCWHVRTKLPIVWGVAKDGVLIAVSFSALVSIGLVWEKLV